MNNNEVPAAKSLRWLAMQFPKVENPQDDSDRLQNCINLYCTNAAYLIECQKSEIERLTINMNAFGLGMKREKERADTARAEAIREFAERLISKYSTWHMNSEISVDMFVCDVKRLAKELTEGNNE